MSRHKQKNANSDSATAGVTVTKPATEDLVTGGALAGLVALGAANALLALFLWGQLNLVRAGGMPFCGFAQGADCVSVWNSSLATAIHKTTGVPVAGWGLVWGLLATAFPLVALWQRTEGRSLLALVSAMRLTAAVGLVTVGAMIAASAVERAFCIGCFGTYVLVAGYAGVALFGWQRAGWPEFLRGGGLAVLGTIAGFFLLLYPGLRTPHAPGEAGRDAIARAGQAPRGTGDAGRGGDVEQLIASLDPQLKQILADSLYIHRNAQVVKIPNPRALRGPGSAPVRLTEFTDIRCEHCADLQKTIASLRATLPQGSFSVDSRQFPLDAECNPLLSSKASDPVRCLAAKAIICLEDNPKSLEYTEALFARQKDLTREQVYELAAPLVPRKKLESCVASEETGTKLQEDIAAAARVEPEGTPIVLVNGRLGTSFGPFLYAMILTQGQTDHPAFATLPPPNPQAHLH